MPKKTCKNNNLQGHEILYERECLEEDETTEEHIGGAFESHDPLLHFLDLVSYAVDGFVDVIESILQNRYLDLDVDFGWLEHWFSL